MKKTITAIILFLIVFNGFSQNNAFKKFDFLIGNWVGTGEGFGNEKSDIKSSFQYVMDTTYIEVVNESQFAPTKKNPKGEHHIDKGFISYDAQRNMFVFRQFNNEGYVNQYILIDSLSNDSVFIFETEIIENFVPEGKARWRIKRISDTDTETLFDVSFPGKEYACFGKNKLTKK